MAAWEAPTVVYPASEVDSGVVCADMESASPMRQSIQAAGKLPTVLSEQIAPGSFAFARDYLVDNELDLRTLNTQFNSGEEAQHWVRYRHSS